MRAVHRPSLDMDLFLRIVEVSREDPNRYPLLNWIVRYFDWFNVAPVGWGSFGSSSGPPAGGRTPA